MKNIHEPLEICGETQNLLDDYLSNEMDPGPRQGVAAHLESCAACSEEFRSRTRVKRLLKAAVTAETAPPFLEARIRAGIRKPEERSGSGGAGRWLMSAATVALIFLVVWIWSLRPGNPDLSDGAADAKFIRNVSQDVAPVFRPGLGDHLHCAVMRKLSPEAPPADRLAETIGPEYHQILDSVRSNLPSGLRITHAHQCTWRHRLYIHLVARGPESLASVVLTRRQPGESFQDQAPEDVRTVAFPLYRAGVRNFEIAGFDSPDFLIYIVSDLERGRNLRLAAALAPGLRVAVDNL